MIYDGTLSGIDNASCNDQITPKSAHLYGSFRLFHQQKEVKHGPKNKSGTGFNVPQTTIATANLIGAFRYGLWFSRLRLGEIDLKKEKF